MDTKTPAFLSRLKKWLDSIYIPFLGISLWRMFAVYGHGIFQSQIGKQAAAISWSFFLSLFPFVLFLLSLLPYLPHYEKLQFYFFEILMPNILPGRILGDVTSYIQNDIMPNMKTVSNFSILLALFFGTNGAFALISGFNDKVDLKVGFIKQYILAFVLTLFFSVVIVASIFGIYYSEIVTKLFTPHYDISWVIENLTALIGFVSFPLFYLLLLSLFYWLGCMKITAWKQAIPGSFFTTALFILLTYGFAIYLKNFARYNVLYGSIGSIIIAMIWVNINIVLILLGNELNLAIKRIRVEKMINDEIKKDFKEIRAQVFQSKSTSERLC